MIYPDEIPLYIAFPVFILLMAILWLIERKERRKAEAQVKILWYRNEHGDWVPVLPDTDRVKVYHRNVSNFYDQDEDKDKP